MAVRPPEGIAVYRNMAATRLKTFSRRHDAPLAYGSMAAADAAPAPKATPTAKGKRPSQQSMHGYACLSAGHDLKNADAYGA